MAVRTAAPLPRFTSWRKSRISGCAAGELLENVPGAVGEQSSTMTSSRSMSSGRRRGEHGGEAGPDDGTLVVNRNENTEEHYLSIQMMPHSVSLWRKVFCFQNTWFWRSYTTATFQRPGNLPRPKSSSGVSSPVVARGSPSWVTWTTSPPRTRVVEDTVRTLHAVSFAARLRDVWTRRRWPHELRIDRNRGEHREKRRSPSFDKGRSLRPDVQATESSGVSAGAGLAPGRLDRRNWVAAGAGATPVSRG